MGTSYGGEILGGGAVSWGSKRAEHSFLYLRSRLHCSSKGGGVREGKVR